jgi:hypothetical protein
MLDLNHLPKTGNGNIDYFYSTGGSNSWVTWEKPRGIHTIVITCIGGGGGGRSGWCTTSAIRSGGGGGGSGGFSRLLIPAVFLPDVLYISVGRGGAGGAAATATGSANIGFDGSFSSVNIAPTNSAIYIVCYANAGAGAVVGSSTTGTAGSGGAAAVQTTALMSGLGQFFALGGQTGATGPTGNPTTLAYPTTGLLLSGGGCGGGGVNNVGGSITTPTQSLFSLIPTRNGGNLGSIAGPGADGISLSQPLMSIGGCGGGSSNSTTPGLGSGGRGGDGGLGCGGGGGGAGPTITGSGAGGRGGDGLVIIQTF